MCKKNMDRLPLTRPTLGTWPATQAPALTGNQTGNLLVYGWALIPLSHTSQGGTFVPNGSCEYVPVGQLTLPPDILTMSRDQRGARTIYRFVSGSQETSGLGGRGNS